MSGKSEQFNNGQKVIVTILFEGDVPAVVIDKTRGAATKVKFADGTVMLIANKIIRAK